MSFFLLLNKKEDILKNAGKQTVAFINLLPYKKKIPYYMEVSGYRQLFGYQHSSK